jgi:4'-phosphopantetheinyl transferase EntD
MTELKSTGFYKYVGLSEVKQEREILLADSPISIQTSCVQRQNEWILSRWALRELFLHQGLDFTWKTLGVLNLRNLDHSHQLWDLSLSHSEQWGGAWIRRRCRTQNIGYDLELRSKSLSALLEARIRRDDDAGVPAIELWSLKEAVFKSLDPALQVLISAKDIQIREDFQFEILKFSQRGCWEQRLDNMTVQSFATKDLRLSIDQNQFI